MSFTIGVDVGGTKVLGGVVDELGKVLRTARRDTPREGGSATRPQRRSASSPARRVSANGKRNGPFSHGGVGKSSGPGSGARATRKIKRPLLRVAKVLSGMSRPDAWSNAMRCQR